MRTTAMPIGLFFALFLTACVSDAPHLNPVDPVFGLRIEGKVERFYTTSPVEDAVVSLEPSQDITRTNQNGAFSFVADAGSYRLICRADGFVSDSMEVTVSEETTVNPVFKLNALPQIGDISLSTAHLATFLPPDQFLINIEVTADDRDGAADISYVWFDLPELSYRDTLARLAPDAGVFVGQIDPRQLGRVFLDDFLGVDFLFYADDLPEAQHQANPRQLIRVIEDTPQIQSPTGVASQPVEFRWQQLSLPFQFRYRIEVYNNVPIALPPILTIDNIAATAVSHTFSGNILAGNYYWVLYVVDAFGNSSRSRQSPLIIN